MTILDRILAEKGKELEKDKQSLPISELKRLRPSAHVRDFKAALMGRPCSLIAEVKRRSPSKGLLREDVDPVAIARTYERSGASAISVLTDKAFFGGTKEDLVRVREGVSIPVLRKDFIIDRYQVLETRLMGADAVLLIAAVLGRRLQEFIGLSQSLDLHALVEVHTEEELSTALESGASIIGINNRDLRTFQTNLSRSISLARMVPEGITLVAESGIHCAEDIRLLRDGGIHAFLVGEALITAEDIDSKIAELLAP